VHRSCFICVLFHAYNVFIVQLVCFMTFSMICVIFKLSLNAFYVHMIFKLVFFLKDVHSAWGLKFEVSSELRIHYVVNHRLLHFMYCSLCAEDVHFLARLRTPHGVVYGY
jgi:hypothetical protein